MKWALYNLAFALVFPALLPGFLLRMARRGGYRARIGDRFALYPESVIDAFAARSVSGTAPVWIHAVSVGEVQVALQLMREWRAAEPDVRFCFSTTSSTGWKIAEGGVGANDVLIYNPLDFPNFVKSALRTVRPRAIVLTESEIWPVFIRRARKAGIPLFLINARVSDRSAPRYRLARWFFKDVFSCFTAIFAQSRLDAERLIAAGAPSGIVKVTGSFKFDVARRNPSKEKELADWIAASCGAADAPRRRILLGASTWPGEDEVMLRAYAAMPDDVLLVIAPRHFEKADAVEANIVKAGFRCVRRSKGGSANADCGGARCVFLADTTGELMGLYGIADAVFVGKSLCEHGSQNMIEPCLCGKPTVVGPNTENFRPVMSDLLEAGAIVQAGDEAQVAATLVKWLSPEGRSEAQALGARAAAAVAGRVGVVPRCLGEIRDALGLAAPPQEAAHGTRRRTPWLWLAPTAVAVALAAAILSGGRPDAQDFDAIADAAAEHFRYRPLDTIERFIGRIEKPDASATNDIVFVKDGRRRNWSDVIRAASPDAAIVWPLDVRDMTMAEFKEALDSFPCRDAHLWMPGETDWVLAGRIAPASVAIGDILEAFSDETAIDDLAEARCDTLPEFFANYVGDRMTCMGAFTGDLSAKVAPERFVTQEIPDVGWVAPGDLDEDILEATAQEMRSLMLVRRSVIEGNMLAKQGKTDDAIEKWASALLRNPHDTMLLGRLHRLAVNAITFEKVGNMSAAAKCYETMLCVCPTDIAAVMAYANCLRRLGKNQMADDVMKRVESLKRSMAAEEAGEKGGDAPTPPQENRKEEK